MDTIERVYGGLSISDLELLVAPRRSLVFALEKLVFRKKTFLPAARILLKLAAAENEEWSNNSAGQFKKLFHLQLSGTEATPDERFIVLDEGLASSDDKIVSVCVQALEATLEQGHFSRSAGAEEIGSRPPLEDWAPKIWRDVFDFHRNGLSRLKTLALGGGKFAESAQKILAAHLRALMNPNLFDEVSTIITEIRKKRGTWLEPLETVGDWLYFDSAAAPTKFRAKVRKFYDSLLPSLAIERALLYTRFWPGDIRDPDEILKKDSHDFEYSTGKAREVAREIAANYTLSEDDLERLQSHELHNIFPFAHELGSAAKNYMDLYRRGLSVANRMPGPNIQFLRGMLSGIESRDPSGASELLSESLALTKFKNQDIDFYTALKITPARVTQIVSALKASRISPAQSVALSYGKGLDHLSADELRPLLDELLSRGGQGVWPALEIITMYQFGKTALDKKIADKISEALTSPALLESEERRTRRGAHHFQDLALRLKKFGYFDSRFATRLSKQLVQLCKVEDSSVFFDLDAPAKALIQELATSFPNELWREISHFSVIATPHEMRRLEDLVGPGRSFESDANLSGPLYKVPQNIFLRWARSDPEVRVPFLFKFLPIFAEENTSPRKWHPTVEKLVKDFGRFESVRDALANRIYPRSWSGSLVPYLEAYIPVLERWYSHTEPEVAAWARKAVRSLEKQVEREKQRDEEGL